MLTMPPKRRQPLSRAGRQAGLTLVELMVGVTLGLLMTAALLRLFADASANGQNLQRASVQIENGRYAAELLREELQLAGFFGEVDLAAATYTTPNPCSTAPASPTDFGAHPLTLPTAVRGYGAAEALGCLNSRRTGTDALAVRRLDVESVAPADLPSGVFALQHSFCDIDPVTGRMVFGTQNLAKDAFKLRDRGCTVRNRVRPYLPRIYYVANCSNCGTGGDAIPTLKRVDLVGGQLVETALVEGVDTLRIEYGFDTDENGTPDLFLVQAQASGAASRWENVVALRLHYVVRSTDKALGESLAGAQTFNLGGAGDLSFTADGYVRRAYSTTVRLINVSGTRELQ
jgi:type IV pilus assembly protein PilW